MFEDDDAGIVPALDTPTLSDAVELVAAVDEVPGVVAYKFGMGAALEHGLAHAVERLREATTRPLIYDHQKAGPDVAGMAPRFAAVCASAGIDAAVLFPLGGPTVTEAFVTACLSEGVVPLVGGDLPEEDAKASAGGYIADDALERIFNLAGDLGVRDFIVPATDPERIRECSRLVSGRVERPTMLMPGVGALGGDLKRACDAAVGCRPFLIIGRGIHQAHDPREAAAGYAADLKEALHG